MPRRQGVRRFKDESRLANKLRHSPELLRDLAGDLAAMAALAPPLPSTPSIMS